MGSSLKVKIAQRKDKTGKEWWEGTVTLAGLKPTKLAKTDGCSQYSTKSSVTQSAQSLGKRLGAFVSFDELPVEKGSKKVCHKDNK